jgi:hypothetical protein
LLHPCHESLKRAWFCDRIVVEQPGKITVILSLGKAQTQIIRASESKIAASLNQSQRRIVPMDAFRFKVRGDLNERDRLGNGRESQMSEVVIPCSGG